MGSGAGGEWWPIGYGTEVTPEKAKVASVAVGIGYICLVVPFVAIAFPHPGYRFHMWAVWTIVGIAVCEGLVMQSDLRRLLRDVFTQPPVSKAVAQVLAATFSAGLVDYAIGGSRGYFRPIVILPVIIASVLGNRAFIAVVWVVSMTMMAVTALAGGVPASSLPAILLIFGATSIGVGETVHYIRNAHLISIDRFDRLVDTTDVVLRSEGFEEALARFLPFAATHAGAERVDACRWGERGATIVGTWPVRPAGNPVVSFDEVPEATAGYSIGDEQTVVRALNSREQLLLVVIDKRKPAFVERASYEAAVRQIAAEFSLLVHHTDFLTQLDALGRTDSLTGLANRRELFERFDQEFEHAKRKRTPLSVAMIDLDHFKEFNDTYGHIKGDQALVELARLLRQTSRASDIVARYGGEEFAMVFPDTDADGATIYLSKVVEQLAALPTSRPITCSIGVASREGHPNVTSMLRAADGALYEAKESGRDRVVVAPDLSNVG